MPKGANRHMSRTDQLFAGPGARADRWRNLVELAESWFHGSGNRAAFEATLAEMAVIEDFHAYPGPQLMAALRDALPARY
jgi:arginine decarboxylase